MITNSIFNTVLFLQSSCFLPYGKLHIPIRYWGPQTKTLEASKPLDSQGQRQVSGLEPWFLSHPSENWHFGAHEIFLVLNMLTLKIAMDCGGPYQSAVTHQGADWTLLFQVPQVYISLPAASGLRPCYPAAARWGGPWGTQSAQETKQAKVGLKVSK